MGVPPSSRYFTASLPILSALTAALVGEAGVLEQKVSDRQIDRVLLGEVARGELELPAGPAQKVEQELERIGAGDHAAHLGAHQPAITHRQDRRTLAHHQELADLFLQIEEAEQR